jgi:hypothetical protein
VATAPITSFTTLVSAVVDYFEDDSTEFKNYIPVAIDLAEQRLSREIDSSHLKTQTNVSCTASSRFINKPTGYKFAYNLRYKAPTGEIKILEKTTDSFIEDYWPWAETSVGSPLYYADYDQARFIIGPTCSNAGDFPLSYTGRPTPLTATTSINVFVSSFSDLLYQATLIEQALFARQNSMVANLEGKYQVLLKSIVNEGRRERRDEGKEPHNPSGNRNTLNANVQPE